MLGFGWWWGFSEVTALREGSGGVPCSVLVGGSLLAPVSLCWSVPRRCCLVLFLAGGGVLVAPVLSVCFSVEAVGADLVSFEKKSHCRYKGNSGSLFRFVSFRGLHDELFSGKMCSANPKIVAFREQNRDNCLHGRLPYSSLPVVRL